MPRSTYNYPFEFETLQWASNFCRTICGKNCGFLIIFDEAGYAEKILFEATKMNPDFSQDLLPHTCSFFLYDPFDAPEYSYIRWNKLNRTTLERIRGKQFSQTSFESSIKKNEKLEDFPENWSVMF